MEDLHDSKSLRDTRKRAHNKGDQRRSLQVCNDRDPAENRRPRHRRSGIVEDEIRLLGTKTVNHRACEVSLRRCTANRTDVSSKRRLDGCRSRDDNGQKIVDSEGEFRHFLLATLGADGPADPAFWAIEACRGSAR